MFLVADGMGGQDQGELASRLAADIIPEAIQDALQANKEPIEAVRYGIDLAHQTILRTSKGQLSSRRMGTTAVLAICLGDEVYVSGVGDSPAYLVRQGKVEQLTIDHTVADALSRSGTLTEEQARQSPWRNVLYRFLGCAEMQDSAEVRAYRPQPGDRLILASDGLSGHVFPEDLRDGGKGFTSMQEWADHLVQLALDRGSRDNVTVVVVAFEAA